MSKYEVGQKWKMRNGLVAEVRRVTGSGEAWANFTDADGVPRHSNFLKSGAYLPGGTENELDLVELVTDSDPVQGNEHSPLPWRINRRADSVVDANDEYVADYALEADAELIVLAVNAHAGVVAQVNAGKEAGRAMLKQEMERTQMVMDLREKNENLLEAIKTAHTALFMADREAGIKAARKALGEAVVGLGRHV